jgi:hypothetical protein
MPVKLSKTASGGCTLVRTDSWADGEKNPRIFTEQLHQGAAEQRDEKNGKALELEEQQTVIMTSSTSFLPEVTDHRDSWRFSLDVHDT